MAGIPGPWPPPSSPPPPPPPGFAVARGGPGGEARSRPGSFWWRWLCLALAAAWGGTAVLVLTHLHESEGGQPVTVYAHAATLWQINIAAIGGALAVAALELSVRTLRRSLRPGVVATVLGVLLCAYSVLGFIFGVLAIAPIGALVICSGRPAPAG